MVDDLAASAHMSSSTFRLHLLSVTSLSPLQYQKQLHLQQARQLMLTQNTDTGDHGRAEGYESARSSAARTAACLEYRCSGVQGD